MFPAFGKSADMDNRSKKQLQGSVPGGGARDVAGPGLLHVVRDVHRGFTRVLQARIALHGVSIGQWFFLYTLWEEDGLTQRELSQRVGMMEPTTVTALNTMEGLGLVERVRNVQDRRKVNIFLTPKGRALKAQIIPAVDDIDTAALAGVSAAELEQAITVLQRVATNIGCLGDYQKTG
jgi:DNA-binding MarR family transcriptional regulator